MVPDWEEHSTPAQANPFRRALTVHLARGINCSCMLATGGKQAQSAGIEVGLTVSFHIDSRHDSELRTQE
jgi:hypothetical protein